MRIGITFDLKPDSPPKSCTGMAGWGERSGFPDDLHEEFDSPVTIDAIAESLTDLGHEVVKLGDGRTLLEHLLAHPPDFVFNMAEGQGVGRCREARVPAVLEMLGIPYTGSDPLTLAATLDKDCAKKLVAAAGVAAPRGFVVEPGKPVPPIPLGFQTPAIVKPAWEGSSKGIRDKCIVERPTEILSVTTKLLADYDQPVLVEEFIDGEEVTVGILGNRPVKILGAMRVLPRTPCERFVYSLEVKRDFRQQVKYECPPDWPRSTLRTVEQAALTCYNALNCRDVARIDFRLRDGIPYFIEANPLPGLNPESSDLVIMATLVGWKYTKLIQAIIQSAIERHSAAFEVALTAAS